MTALSKGCLWTAVPIADWRKRRDKELGDTAWDRWQPCRESSVGNHLAASRADGSALQLSALLLGMDTNARSARLHSARSSGPNNKRL